MRRLRGQEGIALPIAVSVLAIVLLLVGVAVAYSVHSLNRSDRSRASTRALQAADAGLDVAGWRMNKSIVATQYAGILSINGPNGLLNQVLNTLRCTNLSLLGSDIGPAGPDGKKWCEGETELLDDQGGAAAGEAYRYYTDLSIKLDLQSLTNLNCSNPGNCLITRNVVSAGTANGQRAVVMGAYELDLDGFLDENLNLHLFTLKRYVQCSSVSFDPDHPAANCPSI